MDKCFSMDQLVRATWDGNARDYLVYGGELRFHVPVDVETEEFEHTQEAYLRDSFLHTALATADPDTLGLLYENGPWNGMVDLGPCSLVHEKGGWAEQMAEERRRMEMEREASAHEWVHTKTFQHEKLGKVEVYEQH